jgi:proteasome lid subunit RPN8/RPN11
VTIEKNEKTRRQVVISRSATDGIISYSKSLHPNEAILILQGKTSRELILIALSGPYYSGYSNFYLPSDGSYVGSAHSHPGGSNKPSLADLNRGFYGAVSIIIAYPYDERTIAAYDRNGDKLEIKITDPYE